MFMAEGALLGVVVEAVPVSVVRAWSPGDAVLDPRPAGQTGRDVCAAPGAGGAVLAAKGSTATSRETIQDRTHP